MSKTNTPFWLLNFEKGNIIRPPEFCTPKLSFFSGSTKWRIKINGSLIEFRMPKHNPWLKGEKAKYPEKNYKTFRDMKFVDTYRKSDALKDEWQVASLLSNSVWQFKGPFLTGVLADINTSFIVLRQKSKSDSISYFHPRAFENAISDFLTNEWSKSKDSRWSMEKTIHAHTYIAPVEWKAYNYLPVPAARFKVITNEKVASFKATEFFIFTLDNNHLAYMVFNHYRDANSYTKAGLDKKIGDKYMVETVDKVINSFNITLSPDALEQQKKALDGIDDLSVTETFPPLKWDRDIDDTSNEQLKIVAE